MKLVPVFCFFLLLCTMVMQAQDAPVTSAARIINAVPGDPSVPVEVSVTNFNNIGQFNLTIEFDTTRVHFVSAITNPSLSGMSVNYISPSGNTLGKVVFTWTGSSNVSLADESVIADLTFSYVFGTGILNWAHTLGSVCQYKRFVGEVLTLLNDSPKYLFYQNGGISNHSAPVTYAPTILNPAPWSLTLPVTVNGFTNIGTLTLSLEYDPAIITYQNSFTKNPAFGPSFEVGDNPSTGGKRMIVIQWYGAVVSLANGSTICTLNFTYPQATCSTVPLTWYDDGPSCEYTDILGDVLIDMPQAAYYINGLVEQGLPVTWTGNIDSNWDDAGNWNECGIPDFSRNIIIPDVSPKSFPVITVAGYCKSIRIESGAIVTVAPTGSITVGEN